MEFGADFLKESLEDFLKQSLELFWKESKEDFFKELVDKFQVKSPEELLKLFSMNSKTNFGMEISKNF